MSVTAIIVTACGPSKEEIEAKQQLVADSLQKVHTDSLGKLVQDSIKQKQITADSIVTTPSNQKHLRLQLANLQKNIKKNLPILNRSNIINFCDQNTKKKIR